MSSPLTRLLTFATIVAAAAPVAADEPEQTPTARLVQAHGYAEDALTEVDDVRVALSHALDVRAQAGARRAEVQPLRARLAERAELLAEFASEDGLEPDDASARVRRLALARAQVAQVEGEVVALQTAETSLDEESALLGDVLAALEEAAGEDGAVAAQKAAREEELAEQEDEARRAAEEARRREAATKDAALKQLFARERQLREALAEIVASRRKPTEVEVRADELAERFTATKGEILGNVDALPLSPSTEEQTQRVDPLLEQILAERRRLWASLDEARELASRARESAAARRDELEAAQRGLAAEQGRERELGGGELWKQRVKVAETEVALATATLDEAVEEEGRATEHAAMLEEGVEFLSKELRVIIERASPAGRREVYGVLNDAAWSDALQRLNDKWHLARGLVANRAEAGRSLTEQWFELLLWLSGLALRVLFALIPLILLRFVPVMTRRLLDFMQQRKFFRRRPSLAIKIFELLRITARPLLSYVVVTYVLGYVIETFPELVFLQWGVDAFFVYLVGARVSVAVALPRWYREREGLASTGGEDDLRLDEAAIADVLRLDLEHGTKFVRSARIGLLVGTVWYFAPSIVVAITGVSVLSGLITFLTRAAVAVVVYWLLSTWRDELAQIFTRVAGDRIPKATAFVERNKDRRWGVAVVAIVSVVVLVWEIYNALRRALRNTDWFKRASAYAFKTKIELQQRDDPTDAEISAFLPDDLERAFSAIDVVGTTRLVEREAMTAIRADVEAFRSRGHGAVCIVGEPGVGKTTTCRWLVADVDGLVQLALPRRIQTTNELLQLFATHLDAHFETLDDLAEHLAQRPSTTFLVDGLERCFLRDIDGYEAYRSLMELVHRVNRSHVFIVAVNRFGWDFLTRVYDHRHVFQAIHQLPRWSDEELRELVEKRMAGLAYTTSFSNLADLDTTDSSEVVKTARGYYRYLAEFSRGLPTTAMHYWLRSLSGGHGNVYSVGLFSRPGAAELVAAPQEYRFVLAALTQHGELTPAEASRVGNTPLGTCELAAEYFANAGAVAGNVSDGYRLSPSFMSLTLRHLEDSNLL